MGALRPWGYIALLAVAFLAGAAVMWAVSGGEDDAEVSAERGADPGPSPGPDSPPPLGREPGPAGPEEEKPSRSEEIEADVESAVKRYVNAVSDHDGVLLCGTVDDVADMDLPVRRPSCAESVTESIGYRDPRGFPVFDGAVVTGKPRIEVGDRQARAVATVITEFADRDEPSVEDDVIYLVRRAGEWVIAKPSSTLYRAIGVSDVPPDVLEPPGTG
jgi:hypothetical protein